MARVTANVYDLTLLNDYLCPSLLGLFHTGLELGAVEYSFGSHNNDSSGVYQTLPRQNNSYYFRISHDLGPCTKSEEEVEAILAELKAKYKGNSYRLLSRNCNHFADELAERLTGRRLPGYVNRAAGVARHFKCLEKYFEPGSEEEHSQIRLDSGQN